MTIGMRILSICRIINRSAQVLKMSVRDRAAQFAPFAALVGYEQMVQETEGVLFGG